MAVPKKSHFSRVTSGIWVFLFDFGKQQKILSISISKSSGSWFDWSVIMVALIVFFHIYIRAVSHHVSSIFPLSKMYIYPKARHRHKSAVIHFVWVHFQLYFYQRNCVIYVRFYPRNVLLKYAFLVRKRSAAVNYDLGQNKTKKKHFFANRKINV